MSDEYYSLEDNYDQGYELEEADDDYYDYEEPVDMDNSNPFQYGASLMDVYQQCIGPSVEAAVRHLSAPFAYCILFSLCIQLLRLGDLSVKKFHLVSSICGFLCLFNLEEGSAAMYTVSVILISYVISAKANSFGQPMYFWSSMSLYLTFMVVREYLTFRILREDWNQVRGIYMLCSMRALSISHEFAVGTRQRPITLLEYSGYLLCPATVLFGPWLSFETYLKLRLNNPVSLGWFVKIGQKCVYSFACLTVSSCGVYWLFLGLNSRWANAARDAMSVRFSHYFISFSSEIMCLLSGFYSNGGGELTQSVTDPYKIEVPRSLVDVVVHWNKPMHSWLKFFLFRKLKDLGPLKAVLFTFLISSMLHGLHFPVTMVLLSLGIFTYVEYTTREKLASIFDACIRSRRCGPNCTHANKSSLFVVKCTNALLSLLAYFQLVYVGVMMDTPALDEDHNTKWDLILAQIDRWNSLGFAGHWVSLFIFIAMSLV